MGIREKIDRIFLLPPSFHSILSGGILGGIVNLITGLLFTTEIAMDLTIMSIAIIFFFGSVILFCFVSVFLETLREEMHEKPEKGRHLTIHIKRKRRTLYSSFFGGIAFAGVGLLLCMYIVLV